MEKDKEFTKEQYEEYQKLHKDDELYEIVETDPDGRETVVGSFYAKSRKDAYSQLQKFEDRKPGCEYTYYQAFVSFSPLKNGGYLLHVHDFLDSIDTAESDSFEKKSIKIAKSVLKKLKSAVKSVIPMDRKKVKGINKYLYSKAIDMKANLLSIADSYDVDLHESHSMREFWSLDTHVITDIIYNARKLIKDSHSIPYLYEELARKNFKPSALQLDKNDKNLDKAIYEEAKKLWNDKLQTLIDACLEYTVYVESYDVEYTHDDELIELAKKMKSSPDAPIYPGTKKDFDYKKLHKLADLAWNKIWDIWKEIGRDCWD